MTLYRERLWASVWVFLATALVIPATLLVFLPINSTAGVIVAVALYAGCVVLLVIASPRIEISEDTLRAGGARLPLRLIAEASAHRREEATLERGQRLDARAWLLVRGWVDPVVKVVLDDPNDPTPYWLISTRRPEELARALTESRTRR